MSLSIESKRFILVGFINTSIIWLCYSALVWLGAPYLITGGVWVFQGMNVLAYPLHDLNCGIRMFDRQCVAVAKIRHKINMVNPEIFIRTKKAGLVIEEIPIIHSERDSGITSHNLKNSWQIFVEINRYMRQLCRDLKT